MHMNFVRLWFASFTLTSAMIVLPVAAAPNDLALSNAYVQVTIPSHPAAGYFTLKNNGDRERVLVGASSSGCGSIMLHKSESNGGVESMREVDSITVPAHGSVEFAPGGLHLMCMSPTDALKPGTTTQVTLSFKDGDTLTSEFPVRSVTGN
jgi:periplasmic copper chaperone A